MASGMPAATASALIRMAPGSTRLEKIDTAAEWVERFSREWTEADEVSLEVWTATCNEMLTRLSCYRMAAQAGR